MLDAVTRDMDLKLTTMALVGAATLGSGSSGRHTPLEMPWLHGLERARITETPQADVADRMPAAFDALECAASATHGLELVADISSSPGVETVLASYAQGALVLDHEGQVIASSPGYPCEGSADAITALAVGRAFLVPTIAIAVTHGGHKEQTTDLALFRLGFRGRIEAVFTAEVEQRQGNSVRRGAVWLIPNGLIYQSPGGRTALWIYDPVGSAYLYRGLLEDTDEPPHAAAPPVT